MPSSLANSEQDVTLGGDTEDIGIGPQLEDAYRMEVFDDADMTPLANVVETLFGLVKDIEKSNPKTLRQNLQFLIMEFAILYHSGKDYLSYYRGDEAWAIQRGFGSPHGASSKIVRVIDRLHERHFVEHYRGFQNRQHDGRGSRTSRVRPIGQLAMLLQRYPISPQTIRYHTDRPSVFIKEKDGCNADLRGRDAQRFIQQKNEFLERYNALLVDTELNHPDGITPLFKAKHEQVHRVFHRGSIKHGGRFYGGWWVSMKKEKRPFITINGEATVELDYSAQHPHLLYGLELGINYQQGATTPRDIYQAGGIPREVTKTIMLKLISAKGLDAAWKATVSEIRDTITKLTNDTTLENRGDLLAMWQEWANRLRTKNQFHDMLTNQIGQLHPRLLPLFGQDRGTKLMAVDSFIAEYVLKRMTDANIPTLSIHDSFIVPASETNNLYAAMMDAYLTQSWDGRPLTNALPPIKLKRQGEPSTYYTPPERLAS